MARKRKRKLLCYSADELHKKLCEDYGLSKYSRSAFHSDLKNAMLSIKEHSGMNVNFIYENGNERKPIEVPCEIADLLCCFIVLKKQHHQSNLVARTKMEAQKYNKLNKRGKSSDFDSARPREMKVNKSVEALAKINNNDIISLKYYIRSLNL